MDVAREAVRLGDRNFGHDVAVFRPVLQRRVLRYLAVVADGLLEEGDARIAFFKETISNHCEVAQNTPLEDWPKDGNVVPKIPIAESDGFPGDIQLGDDANITWSGLAVPADGVSEVVRIERLTLKRTDSVRAPSRCA